MTEHVHKWINHEQKRWGFFSKRDGDERYFDVDWYQGHVLRCRFCPAFLFVPDDTRFASVEAELVETPKEAVAA